MKSLIPSATWPVSSAVALMVTIAIVATSSAQDAVTQVPSFNQAEIVEIEDAVKRFEASSKQVTEARKQLAQPHPAFVKFAESLKKHRSNPNDPQTAAAYAEAFAEAVQVMNQRHSAFLELKDQVEQDYEAFRTITEARKEALQRQRDQSQQSADSYGATVTEWEGKLDELAGRYVSMLESGSGLPAEVDELAERADIQIAHAKTKETLFRSFAKQAERNMADADRSLRMAKHWFHRARLHFLNAEGHTETLGLIAAAGSQQLDSSLPNLGWETVQLDPIDDPPILNGLLAGLAATLDQPSQNPSADQNSEPKNTAGAKILLRRLEQSRRPAPVAKK